MARPAQQWDERLNDLASALEPIPTRVAVLESTLGHWEAELESVPARLAVLAATVTRLAEENHALHLELAATQRYLVQMSCGFVVATLGAAGAIIAALI